MQRRVGWAGDAGCLAALHKVWRRCLRPQPRHVVGVVVVGCGVLILLLLWTTTNLQAGALAFHNANTRIAVLSDIHFSSHYTHISQEFLEAVVSSVNNLEPALVLVVGDVVNNDPSSAPVIGQALAQLKTLVRPGGILVTLGNHDDRGIVATLRDLGLEVLVNEVKYPLGQGLAFVGLGDVWLGDFAPARVLDALPPSLPRIVAGHTHATQIRLPFVGAVLPHLHRIKKYLLPRWIHDRIPYLGYTNVMEDWDLVYGLHSLAREGPIEAGGDPNNRVLITAGVGTTPPFRLAVPPEVMLLTLVPAPQS